MVTIPRTAATWLVLAALLPALAGCGSSSAKAGPSFKNPVYAHDFPDPMVIKAGKTYYAYATNTNNEDIPTLHSKDLVHWTAGPDAFPVPPRWAVANIWAPDVYHRPDGKYVLYYAASDSQATHECIGHAVSSSPSGPFIDRSAHAFICQSSRGGDIDPAHFVDTNGTHYLLWKNDGNCCGDVTYLWSQKMAPDGMTLIGKPAQLLTVTQNWEGNLIEAPFMWKHGSTYDLFFSANDYASFNYAVGYAACKTPLGPCTAGKTNPILGSKCKAAGPGGETIVTDAAGQTWMLYHAWSAQAVGDPTVGRELWLDRLDWKNGVPVVHGPTCGSQPGPVS